MREFIKEMRDDAEHVDRRFVAGSTISSLLAPVALVLGLATLLGYDPIIETLAWMGVPSWAPVPLGIIEVAAAVALVVPVASVFGAAAMIAICATGAALYVRLSEPGYALVLGGVAVAFLIDLVIRAPELGSRGRRLWTAAGRAT